MTFLSKCIMIMLTMLNNVLSAHHLSVFFFLSIQLYISEMSHEQVRGTLGSCVQLMVVLGIMGVYLAGMYAQLLSFD